MYISTLNSNVFVLAGILKLTSKYLQSKSSNNDKLRIDLTALDKTTLRSQMRP